MVGFEGVPKSLNEHIVDCTSFSVHADPDAFCHTSLANHVHLHCTCKLAAMVTVDDLGFAVALDGEIQGLNDPGGFHRVRQTPAHKSNGMRVDHD